MMTQNRKIRVLRVITWLPVGGIERKLVDVLPRLDPERFEVSLVCIRERGPLADDLEAAGIRVDLIPFRNRWDPKGLRALAALMRERQIDVVHSHMYRANVPATVAARIAGIRNVWSQVHNVGTWESGRQLFVDRLFCRWRTGMIAVSDRVRADVMEQLGLPSDRVRVVYNGVDVKRFRRNAAARTELRSEQGVSEGDVVFLMAARLVPQKRPQDFIEMARHLAEALPEQVGRAHFWMVGDGSMLEELKSQAEQLPDSVRMKFFGRRDDVPRFISAADVFVMTSTKEGFSNALMEALAGGLAVIATDVGGNAEAVRHEQDGLILQPEDQERLNAMAERLLTDDAARIGFGSAAADRAKTFSVDAMVAQLEDLYAETVGDTNVEDER